MKKERRPLTKREKVLIGVGVVGAVTTCAAGYLGYKYWANSKALEAINEDLLRELSEKNVETSIIRDELDLIKYLLIEGDVVPKAAQNGGNKIARKESKIKGIIQAIEKMPTDKTLRAALRQHEREYKFMMRQQELTEQLKIKIENDECIYAK